MLFQGGVGGVFHAKFESGFRNKRNLAQNFENTDFSKIKKTFLNNIKKTKRDNQVIVMEMMSFTALNKLIYEKKMFNQFDIIFIDASHEANDVILDAVLSWRLLKVEGILIFDDYKWKKIVQKNYRPALAIDSFIEIYKPEIEVLNIGWQFILKKIEKDDSDLPIVTENIFNEVNDLYDNYFEKFYNFKVFFSSCTASCRGYSSSDTTASELLLF